MKAGSHTSIYFGEEIAVELEAEAKRQGRGKSWLVHRAWLMARRRIAAMPTASAPEPEPAPAVSADDFGYPGGGE